MSAKVLIIGAGPAGLAVAACLKQRQVPFQLIDRRGIPGGAYNILREGGQLLSPARYNTLPIWSLGSSPEYVTFPEYRSYLHEYSARLGLSVDPLEVSHIERGDRGWRVDFLRQGSAEYRAVVVATGMVDSPRLPEIAGRPVRSSTVMHSRDWPGPEQFRGQRVLIIGGGMSGVEVAEECVRCGVHVTISSRHRIRLVPRRILGRDIHDWVHLVSHRIPRWLVRSHCERLPAFPAFDRGFRTFRKEQSVVVRPAVRHFHDRTATLEDGSHCEFDVLIFATGYEFATPFLDATFPRRIQGQPTLTNYQNPAWPHLYFIGFPCARIFPSEFLRGIALDAPILASMIDSM
ncbi:MAG: NAD(P)/FAD-dependent oxidoreductase [Planctomycetaceae bacterium]|nr:NAD(P)/FAD-dependent oxidoreductase [Planctomycetaceae bacterium]